MKRFVNNLSTSRKLILSFGILVLLLATVVIVAYLRSGGHRQFGKKAVRQ